MNFETYNSQYGEVKVAYENGRVIVSFTSEQQAELGKAEAELIMQGYVDTLGEYVEVGNAYMYINGYWSAHVFDAE